MSPAAIAVLTFMAITLLVGVIGVAAERKFFHYRQLTNERLNELSIRGAPGTRSSLFNDLSRGERGIGRCRGWLDEYVDQSGIHVSVPCLAAIAFGLAATLGAIALCLNGRCWVAALAAVGGLLIVPGFVRVKRQRRMHRLFLQLPQALELIARAVRAGQTVPAAFRLVAEELEPPIASDFRNCYERQNLGMSYDTSLRLLARRTGIVELQILAVVLLVQSRSGGNLVELLGELTDTVYKRLKFKQRVRALTSEGRMQAAVLIVLPTVAFFGLHFVSPDYVATLHQHPKVLAATVIAQVLGALWIRQYVKCDF